MPFVGTNCEAVLPLGWLVHVPIVLVRVGRAEWSKIYTRIQCVFIHLLGINLQTSIKNVRDLEDVFILFKLTPSTRVPSCPARHRSSVKSVCRRKVAHCGEWLAEMELPPEQGRQEGKQGAELLLLQRRQPCWSGIPLQGPLLLVDATVHCSPRPAEMTVLKVVCSMNQKNLGDVHNFKIIVSVNTKRKFFLSIIILRWIPKSY